MAPDVEKPPANTPPTNGGAAPVDATKNVIPKSPRVFTVAPDKSFLDSVAQGVLAEAAGDQLKLSDYTILVPNRETRDLLRQAFMEQQGGKPGILPRIDAPGDVDSDDLGLKVSDSPIL